MFCAVRTMTELLIFLSKYLDGGFVILAYFFFIFSLQDLTALYNTNNFFILLRRTADQWGAQWLSGRVLDSRPRGRGFEPHRRHCVVSLSKNINPSLVLVQPRKTHPYN